MNIPTKEEIWDFYANFSKEEINDLNDAEIARHKVQHEEFSSMFDKWMCYICDKSLKTASSEEPCLHNLLRLWNFKKKNFVEIYKKWSYINISSYLRWVANKEKRISNINDLEDEKHIDKKFEYTIRWKNIEWTFSCSNNDFGGHQWRQINFPHYHFQMRINKKPFIDFTDFHIPFTRDDLFLFNAVDSWKVRHSNWIWWFWMQELLDSAEFDPDFFIDNTFVAENQEKEQFHLSTIITWNISGDFLADVSEESKRTWKTMAAILKQRDSKDISIQTIITPAENLPDIATRKQL